jgi:geranylgeranyl diphosphate synthase type I
MAASSYEAVFGPIVADIEAELWAARQEHTEIAPILWKIVDYQFGWDQPPEQRPRVSGKKIRPVLMALVAKAICGDYRHVLPAGAALELVHNFTLIHDDVMDKSAERRHRPTVWKLWGSAQAVNAGDAIYALANLACARLLAKGAPPEKVVTACRALSQACLWTAEGQMLDVEFETRDAVTTDEYITMVSHKTGALIEAAAKIGALLSADDARVVESYASFGRALGIAFQIRDDYLGVWGDEAQTGKSATTDIQEKKKTYPILAAVERADDADRAALRRLYAQEALSSDDVQTALAIMDRVGAAAQTDQIAQRYYDTAMTNLDGTGIQNETQDLIRRYAAFLIQRAY